MGLIVHLFLFQIITYRIAGFIDEGQNVTKLTNFRKSL